VVQIRSKFRRRKAVSRLALIAIWRAASWRTDCRTSWIVGAPVRSRGRAGRCLEKSLQLAENQISARLLRVRPVRPKLRQVQRQRVAVGLANGLIAPENFQNHNTKTPRPLSSDSWAPRASPSSWGVGGFRRKLGLACRAPRNVSIAGLTRRFEPSNGSFPGGFSWQMAARAGT